MVADQILARFEHLEATLDTKHSPRHDFWVEDQWQEWKHLLRAIGKRICVDAAIKSLGRMANRVEESLAGTGKLPPDVHDAITRRLRDGIIAWLAADNPCTRSELNGALSAFADTVAAERAKYSFQVVSSTSQLIDVVASIAQACIAHSSFEKHIRNAFVRADSLDVKAGARFRELLANRITSRSTGVAD